MRAPSARRITASSVRALLVAVVCLAIGTAALVTAGDLPSDLTSQTSSAPPASDDSDESAAPPEVASPARVPLRCATREQLLPRKPEMCRLTPLVPGAPTLVLWGDSHAWQLIPAIKTAIGDRRVNVVSFMIGGCPPFDPGFRMPRDRRGANGCERVNDIALRFVRGLQADGARYRVLIAGAWELYRFAAAGSDGPWTVHTTDVFRTGARYIARGTTRLFETLADVGAPTDLVGQMPMVPTNNGPCEGRRLYQCDVTREGALVDEALNRDFLEGLVDASTPGARLIEPAEALCDQECPAVRDDVYVMYDILHIGAQVSRTLASYFAPTIDDLLRG